ncbi:MULTISPECIES: cation:dicarboxylate symporter family transporter [unclassified Streptomyces]|uniref:cation:dicarboxylate symporter family transporter n=1 Tax=unclassified Streptomyces TaxID=2593676 RepID=UPI0004C1C23B|nr:MULTISPECIES: cation:dicarboxylase symporter family transporter [unclassified Streptomyces]
MALRWDEENSVSTQRMARQRPFHRSLAFWVLLALGLGALFGAVLREDGARLRGLPDLFLSVMTMFIAPIVFTTVVGAIAVLGDFRRFGRVSARVPLLRGLHHPRPGHRPAGPGVIAGWAGHLDGDRLRHTFAASLTVDPDRPEDVPPS